MTPLWQETADPSCVVKQVGANVEIASETFRLVMTPGQAEQLGAALLRLAGAAREAAT